MKISKQTLLALLALTLAGCSPNLSTESLTKRQATQTYQSAMGHIKTNQYALAIDELETVQLNYPQYAEYDHILYHLADLQFKLGRYIDSKDNAREYLISNPQSKYSEHMAYVEGMSLYHEKDNWVAELFLSPRHLRDNSELLMAKDKLNAFIAHYPKSKYRVEVNKAMVSVADQLARGEIEVANYNLNHKAYLGAIMRAEKVIKLYPKTNSAKEAYAIIDQSYKKLNLKSEHAELKKKLKAFNHEQA